MDTEASITSNKPSRHSVSQFNWVAYFCDANRKGGTGGGECVDLDTGAQLMAAVVAER